MTRRDPASDNAGPANSETAAAKRAASSSSLDGGTDKAAQLPFDYSGRDKAEVNADLWWWSTAMAGITTLAATGQEFEAFDIADRLGVPEPDHCNRWGALLSAAAKAGMIVAVGAKPSRRPTAAGHLCRTWRGAA